MNYKKLIIQKLNKAKAARSKHEDEISEALQYTYPNRDVWRRYEGTTDRTKLFDATASDSVQNLLSTILTLLIPQNQQWGYIGVRDDRKDTVGADVRRVLDNSNKMMFNIGIFPYAMLASLVLFLPPCPSLLESAAGWQRHSAAAPPPRTDPPGTGVGLPPRTQEERPSPSRSGRREAPWCLGGAHGLRLRTVDPQVPPRARRCLRCAEREGEPRAVHAAALAPLAHAADDASARGAA